jgi:C-terminal processing protease CtpA/Prc
VSNNTQGQVVAFAGILQSLGRARIVGEPTQARVAVLNTINLPNIGARLQIPTGDYLSLKNANWYQTGVEPDTKADRTWEEITADDDAQLNQAVDVLQGR